jgi:hypothetical protein
MSFKSLLFGFVAFIVSGSISAHAQCTQTDVQVSPRGGGLATDAKGPILEFYHATGHVSFMFLAYNDVFASGQAPVNDGHWLLDDLNPFVSQDNQTGRWPIKQPQKFLSRGGDKTWSLRIYGWIDSGHNPYIGFEKRCTATQTAMAWGNGYDTYPNFAVRLTWDREYKAPPSLEEISKMRIKNRIKMPVGPFPQ